MLTIAFILFFPLQQVHPASDATEFEKIHSAFISGYTALNIPPFTYDSKDYFYSVPTMDSIEKQEEFFNGIHKKIAQLDRNNLEKKQKTDFDFISYETAFNLKRIHLEKEWVSNGRVIPSGGLYSLPSHAAWYSLFIQKFTSTETTPEEIFGMGKAQVEFVKKKISALESTLGFTDETAFYNHLTDSAFFLTDKTEIANRFQKIDSTVRSRLAGFVEVSDLPPVYPMEWPGANRNTPPGMYLNKNDNPYGKDVFQYNFYSRQFNYRVMEWLYMHEAIPGHHLQSVYRTNDPLHDLFLYPGNFEGWACYVEYYGKELGLYNDPYSELGKWEWDLVRSARLVIDCGIHYYGWSYSDAITYWKENIRGQDDIADREVTRVTNWPAQALSYKVGASFIFDLQEEWKKNNYGDEKTFRTEYLRQGMLPLEVMKKSLLYKESK